MEVDWRTDSGKFNSFESLLFEPTSSRGVFWYRVACTFFLSFFNDFCFKFSCLHTGFFLSVEITRLLLFSEALEKFSIGSARAWLNRFM